MSDVEIASFEELRGIGERTSSSARDLSQARTAVAGTDGEHGLYSSYPAAQRLASHHDAVAKVFLDTLAALRDEMDEFGQTIVTAVRRYEDTEEDVQASFSQIRTRIDDPGPSATSEAFDASRTTHGDDLRRDEEADAETDDQGYGF